MKTEREIKLKTGATLPKGLPVTFNKEIPSTCTVYFDREYKVRVCSAFTRPSMEEMEDVVISDAACPSIAGYDVEPDGWDCEGTPSWLLALGMI